MCAAEGSIVPHTSDRSRRNQRTSITGEPPSLAERGLPLRGRAVRTCAAVTTLQSVLLQCFAYPRPDHPWDPQPGRRFPGLFNLYGSWVSPQPDMIVMGSTVSHRFCSYLLPWVHPDGAEAPFDPRCRGIPGLRLADCHRWGYELLHLPTGAVVQVRDSDNRTYAVRERVRALESEMNALRRRKPDMREAWNEPAMTAVELRWSPAWVPTTYTAAASTLFSVLSLFLVNPDVSWQSSRATYKELGSEHLHFSEARPEAPAVFAWCHGIAPARVLHHLRALRLDHQVQLGEVQENFAALTIGGGRLDLHRRSSCIECGPGSAFRPAPVSRDRQRSAV